MGIGCVAAIIIRQLMKNYFKYAQVIMGVACITTKIVTIFFIVPDLEDYHIYPTPPLGQDMAQGQFLAEFNRFEFRVFFLLD